jgi:hypothetical protein
MKTIEPFLGSAHFIKRNSVTNMKRKFLCYKIPFQIFIHGLGFKGPSHPKTNVVKLILDDETSWFEFSILSLDCFKLMMTPTILKFVLFQYVICHNAKYLTSKEGDMEKLHIMLYPPKSKVFNFNWSHNQLSI